MSVLRADRVIVFDRRRPYYGLPDLWRSFKGPRFDLAINMRIYGKSVFPTLLTRAPVRLGMPRTLTRDGTSLANTHHLPDTAWKHWQDIYLDFLPALGLSAPTDLDWSIQITPEEREEQREFFAQAEDGPVIGIVLASSSRGKDWPAERLIELVDAIRSTFGLRALLLGGASPHERDLASRVASESVAEPWVGLDQSVRDMIWRIDGCDLLISPDTGPLHVAHALGVPVIGLFGRTNPWRCGPYSRFQDLLVDRYTAPGSEPDPTHSDPRDGMRLITVDEVLDRIERARNNYGADRRKVLGQAPDQPQCT